MKRLIRLVQRLRSPSVEHGEESDNSDHDMLEIFLLNKFKELLNIDSISVTDDFYDLGGTSLATHELVVSLGEVLGEEVSLFTLINASSVLELKMAIRDDFSKAAEKAFGRQLKTKTNPHQPVSKEENMIGSDIFPDELYHRQRKLVLNWSGEIKSEHRFITGRNVKGARTPLLWCCQGQLEFEFLAEKVGQEQPVYAMRSGFHIFDADKQPELTTALAEFYLKEVSSIVPQGARIVAGNCQAGLIALKIADMIHQSGEEVRLVLLNYIVPEPRDYAVHSFLGESEASEWYGIDSKEPIQHLEQFPLFTYDYITGNHGDYFHADSNYLDKMKSYLEAL